MAVAMEKSHVLLIRFLKFHCFNAGSRVRLFQDSIPKCLKPGYNFAI